MYAHKNTIKTNKKLKETGENVKMKKVSYREYYLALRELQGKVDDRISITDLGGSYDSPAINLGVNWVLHLGGSR